MKGEAGPASKLRRFDPGINLGSGGFNLERGSWWSSDEGKEQLQAELAARLHHVHVAQSRSQHTSKS